MMKPQKSWCFRFFSIIITLMIMCNIAPAITFATDIDSFLVDSITRWTHNEFIPSIHMGCKNTTYQYASSTVKSNYSSYVTGGTGLWGSCISCTETSSSPMGIITVPAMNIDATATTSSTPDPSNNHISSWVITIYSIHFDDNTNAGKYRTIAHEFGHVYGLGHVDYSSQIMYHTYSETKSVTSYDIAGMDVMTHTHVHTGTYSTTIEQHSTYRHKVRCNSCKAYKLTDCLYHDYHSGTKHYLKILCICGNNTTQSWDCSGNPCILPF